MYRATGPKSRISQFAIPNGQCVSFLFDLGSLSDYDMYSVAVTLSSVIFSIITKRKGVNRNQVKKLEQLYNAYIFVSGNQNFYSLVLSHC